MSLLISEPEKTGRTENDNSHLRRNLYSSGLSKSVTALPTQRQTSRDFSSHETQISNNTNSKGQSLPNSPPQMDTKTSQRRYYDAKSYEDITDNGYTAMDGASRRLESDMHRRERAHSPASSSSSNQAPVIGQLDFTMGSRESNLDGSFGKTNAAESRRGGTHAFRRIHGHDDLDISLEHETKGRLPHQYHNRHAADTDSIPSPRSDRECYQKPKQTSSLAPNFSKSSPDLQKLNYNGNPGPAPLKVYGDIDFSEGSQSHQTPSSRVGHPQQGSFLQRQQSRETGSDSGSTAVLRNKEGKTLRECTSPIQSARLRPIRQKTRNAVVSI